MSLKEITSMFGYQQITSMSAAGGLTVPTKDVNGVVGTPARAWIVAEAQAVRWRDDGTAPSASVGMPLAVGVLLEYSGDLSRIQFIEQTSGAKLNITYHS